MQYYMKLSLAAEYVKRMSEDIFLNINEYTTNSSILSKQEYTIVQF